MAFRALREVKIRGQVYKPGETIPGIATYYGLGQLIRRGRVEEFEPHLQLAKDTKQSPKPAPVQINNVSNGTAKVAAPPKAPKSVAPKPQPTVKK